jgi:hypothetical protein
MIIGTVQSSELWDVESTWRAMLADHAIAISDTPETFDVAARAWLVHHRSGCSERFAVLVTDLARVRHTARTVRLELTASELTQLADLLAAATATGAVASLRGKVAGAAERMDLQADGTPAAKG